MSISYQKNSKPDTTIYVWDQQKRLASVIRSFLRCDYYYRGDTVFTVTKYPLQDSGDLNEFSVTDDDGRIIADDQNRSYNYSADGRHLKTILPNIDTSIITFENGNMISDTITGINRYNEIYTYSYYPELDKRDFGGPSVGNPSKFLVHTEIKSIKNKFSDTVSYSYITNYEYSFDKSGRPETEIATFNTGGVINFRYFYEEE